jgi:predicted Holliday junction resolvase-like endonuclease
VGGAQVVIVLLAICLILFLVVAIALIVMVVRLTFRIKSLMRSAETMTENIAGAVSTTKGAAAFFALMKATLAKKKKGKQHE